MNYKTSKTGEKFVMCAGCGKTFRAKDLSFSELDEHQEKTNCEGYFTIETMTPNAIKN